MKESKLESTENTSKWMLIKHRTGLHGGLGERMLEGIAHLF